MDCIDSKSVQSLSRSPPIRGCTFESLMSLMITLVAQKYARFYSLSEVDEATLHFFGGLNLD